MLRDNNTKHAKCERHLSWHPSPRLPLSLIAFQMQTLEKPRLQKKIKKCTLVTMALYMCVCVCVCLLCAELGFSVSARRIISLCGWGNSCDAHLSLSHSLCWRMERRKTKAFHINIKPYVCMCVWLWLHTHTDTHTALTACEVPGYSAVALWQSHTQRWGGLMLARGSNN